MAERIKLSEVYAKLEDIVNIQDDDKIAAYRKDGTLKGSTIKSLKNKFFEDGDVIRNLGDFNNFSEFELSLKDDISKQGYYFGTLNGVGVFVKITVLSYSDGKWLYEISGGLDFDARYYPRRNFVTSEIWRTFTRLKVNGDFLNEWQVKDGFYDLGKVETSVVAENRMSKPYLCRDESIIYMCYNSQENNADEKGILLQQVQSNITTQYLYWKGNEYIRHIKFTDSERLNISEIENFTQISNTIIRDNSFVVCDSDGNVVLRYSNEGLDAAEVTNHLASLIKKIIGVEGGGGSSSISSLLEQKEVEENGVYFVDADMNVVASIDDKGLHSINIIEYIND